MPRNVLKIIVCQMSLIQAFLNLGNERFRSSIRSLLLTVSPVFQKASMKPISFASHRREAGSLLLLVTENKTSNSV